MTKTYAVLAAIVAVVLGVYFALPNRYFTESVFPLTDGMTVVAYDDKADGGLSEAEFSAKDSLLEFSCTLGADTSRGAWCGLVFDLSQGEKGKYRNWTFVDSVVFDVEAHGTKEVLVKIWAFDPDVTKPNQPRSFRLLLKEVSLEEGRQRVVVPMEHFYTPDFWYTDGKVDPSMNRRHQESIARLEIAPGWNQKRGQKYSLAIHEVTAKGVSNFAFGVVLFIILGLTVVAIGRKNSSEKKIDGK